MDYRVPLIRAISLSALLLLAGHAHAQQRPSDVTKSRAPPTRAKPATANSCAQFGAGFVHVAGSETCVKIGGSVRVGAGVSR